MLLEEDLLLNLLLLRNLWRRGNLRSLAVEGDLGLLKITTRIYKNRSVKNMTYMHEWSKDAGLKLWRRIDIPGRV